MEKYLHNVGYAGPTSDGEEIYMVTCPDCNKGMKFIDFGTKSICDCGYLWELKICAHGVKDD